MARAHSAAAAVLVAGIVLGPLGMWLYAQAASVDRGAQVAHANRLLTEVAPPVPGARRLVSSVYERRKWEGESLVPIAGYNVETAYRLEHRLRPVTIVEHYRRELAGWRVAENTADFVTFAQGNDTISIDIVEYLEGKTMRSYGVMVSQ
jgi:hypothetical protein